MTFPVNELRYDVDSLFGLQPVTGVSVGPHTTASGTANSITPRRQLSQKWLLRTMLSLPPAIHMPVPTGTGTEGCTSSALPASLYGLKLLA